MSDIHVHRKYETVAEQCVKQIQERIISFWGPNTVEVTNTYSTRGKAQKEINPIHDNAQPIFLVKIEKGPGEITGVYRVLKNREIKVSFQNDDFDIAAQKLRSIDFFMLECVQRSLLSAFIDTLSVPINPHFDYQYILRCASIFLNPETIYFLETNYTPSSELYERALIRHNDDTNKVLDIVSPSTLLLSKQYNKSGLYTISKMGHRPFVIKDAVHYKPYQRDILSSETLFTGFYKRESYSNLLIINYSNDRPPNDFLTEFFINQFVRLSNNVQARVSREQTFRSHNRHTLKTTVNIISAIPDTITGLIDTIEKLNPKTRREISHEIGSLEKNVTSLREKLHAVLDDPYDLVGKYKVTDVFWPEPQESEADHFMEEYVRKKTKDFLLNVCVLELAKDIQKILKRNVIITGESNVIINSDRGLLMQIIDELLQNALKHSPPGSPILVNISKTRKNDTLLDIENYGTRISIDDLVRIPRENYRGQNAFLGNVDGSGRGLIEAHLKCQNLGIALQFVGNRRDRGLLPEFRSDDRELTHFSVKLRIPASEDVNTGKN